MTLNIPSNNLKFLRFMIAIQVFVAAWFLFSPDILPSLIKEAEMQNDQPLYETLDNIIVPLAHVQTLLCLALWWPTKLVSWAYLLDTIAIAALGLFAGPAILSAIDGLFGYVQVLASGALLSVLFLNRLFALTTIEVKSNA